MMPLVQRLSFYDYFVIVIDGIGFHMTLLRELKGVRSACCRICASPESTRDGEKKRKRQWERQRTGEPGRRGRRRDRERRGSGGQALPANQRRAQELQKTEPGARGSQERGGESGALRGREQRALSSGKVPSLLLIH